MSTISKYGPAYTQCALNTKILKHWSNDDEPIVIKEMNPKRDIEIHHGGGGICIERMTNGAELALSFQPGSEDAAFCSGLYNSGAPVEFQFKNLTTDEIVILSLGFSTSLGDIARGFKPSNANFSFKFVKFVSKL